jgi:hypothetical protein
MKAIIDQINAASEAPNPGHILDGLEGTTMMDVHAWLASEVKRLREYEFEQIRAITGRCDQAIEAAKGLPDDLKQKVVDAAEASRLKQVTEITRLVKADIKSRSEYCSDVLVAMVSR